MRIKLRTPYASPTRSANPGDEIEVSEEEGRELIDGKYAVRVGQPIETASFSPRRGERAARQHRQHE